MRINKYNKPKNSTSGSGRATNTVTFVGGSISGGGGICDEARKLLETHLIYGQPFNGTQDVDGELTTSGSITADGDISTKAAVNANTVNADSVNAATVDADSIVADTGSIDALSGSTLKYTDAEIKKAIIDTLTSIDITTENLTVTKQAHFFELIIDKIKAAGGAILLTPADGFKVDLVREVNHAPRFYKLYWKATDGDKAISNMWKVGDQAICQTFNNAEVGTNYNVSNKYYWSLVKSVGTETIEGIDYHYIQIEGSENTNTAANYDGVVNPEVGDEIAMLGYRGTDDADRQSAIYLAAYSSIDPTLKAPLICHYKGINNFDLKSHKYTYFAANGSEIRGNLKVESGKTVEEEIADKSLTIVSNIIEYATSTSGTTAPTTGWTTTVPYTPPSNYLWSRTTVNYSDGSSTVSYSVTRFGANGKAGDQGDSGKDGASYTDNLLLGTQRFEGTQWKNLSYWTDANQEYMGCKVLKRDANSYGVYQEFNAIEGETYTFSAYVKSDGGDVRYYFTISTGDGVVTPLQKDVPEESSWSRQAVSFKCTKSGVIGCRVQKASDTGAIYVAGLKLERGENPNTSWSLHRDELNGEDADFYKLIPVIETATANLEDMLSVNLSYQIAHIIGNTSTVINNTGTNYRIRFKGNTESPYTLIPTGIYNIYSNSDYQPQYSNNRDETITYFQVELIEGSNILDRRIIPVKIDAAAVIEVTNDINFKVNKNTSNITTNTNDIANLKISADSITSTVEQHTTEIDNIQGQVNTNTTNISSIQQKANSIESRVTFIQNTVNYDLNNPQNWNSGTLDSGAAVGTAFNKMYARSSSVVYYNHPIQYTPDTYICINEGYQAYITYYDNDKNYLGVYEGWLSGDNVKLKEVTGAGYFGLAICKYTMPTITYEEGVKAGVIISDTKITQSLIRQTADQILLKVDEVALSINDKKIVLDGDTEINGNLTMDNSDQGFILKGDSGITQITPQSIGSYIDFTSKATTTIPIAWKRNQSLLNGAEQIEMYDYQIGQLSANTAISIRKGAIKGNWSGVTKIEDIFYIILKDGSQVKSVKVATTTNSGTILDYTTTQSGNYTIRVQFTLRPWVTTTSQFDVSLDLILPTGCFSLIGYDGMAMNFGNQKTVYFGSDGAYISYGSNRLKIDSTGIYKFGGVKQIEPQYMNLGEKVDTALSRYDTEYAPLNGCVVRRIVGYGTTYLQPNDEFIGFYAITGTTILQLPTPSKNVGRKIYVKKISDGSTCQVKGTMKKSNNTDIVESINVDVSYMFICDGIAWNAFYCG